MPVGYAKTNVIVIDKVKIIKRDCSVILEKEVNKFIEDKCEVNIQFTTVDNVSIYAFITYEEVEC